MEGDGEGLVAIVQGLDTSGVTLTVCNRARHNSDRRRSSRHRIQINTGNTRPADMPPTDHRSNTFSANSATLANQRSSMATSTGTDFARQHTSSQICDGRYASSYKLAHCMVTPTSPPEAVSEFPPQRKEPCHNQGNFEIGGHGSGHSSGKVRVSSSRVRHYGGSQTWGDKGSSHRYCKSNRDTEAFAHSLRKYPSMAPFRTASTDLIEKLIRYTQAKNFQEMSRSSKSMRSLRQQKSSDTYEMARASKQQQTYTRSQDNNTVNNSSVQVGYRGRARNFKLYSPMSDSRNLKENRHRETKFSSSYDYLKAGISPYGRPNRSDESPSPVGSSSPERTRSPDRLKSLEVSRSPVRFKSIDEFKNAEGSRGPRLDRPIRFERSVRDLSLSDMSKYIRNTIRQICNEQPVVFQVCPKLKNRYNQHKKVCPNKSDRASDVMEDEPEEDQDEASGSVISRLIQSFSGYATPSTDQAECQCTRTDCYCTKGTQCVNNPDASTNTHSACSCKIPTKIGCCRGMPCVCASKSQDQAYYNKRIDEEIAEWLKDVPVHSIEGSDNKKKRDTVIKELRKTLKQFPDDENYDENARNEIKIFIDDFPLWNPGKDRKDEKLFKNQLADKLTEKILSIPRKPDRFKDIVKKWVANMDFEDDGEEVDKETIIDKFVNKLKSIAVDRPVCDVKYTHTLRKEIIELLVELALKFDGNMVMLKKMANKLATEIVSIPRNVNLSGDTTDLTDEFKENVSDWICEHGLCVELKKDPKLIEGLARKLNKLKSHGIDDECVVEKMKEEIHQFVDDVGIAIETIDELIDELMKQLSNTVQTNEMEKLDQDELTEVFTDWLNNLPGASDLHPRKFEKIVKEVVKVIIEGREQGNENLANDILSYLVDADLGIDPADLGIYVEELMEKINFLPSNNYNKEQIKKAMIKDIVDIIENLPVSQGKKKELRKMAQQIVENHLLRSSLNSKEAHDDMKDAIMEDMDDAISGIDIPKESRLRLKASLGNMLNSNFEKSFMRLRRLSREGSDLKQTIAKDVRNAVKELPIDTDKKNDLMQQVKRTLSKNMHKPLPSNVKNTINDEISNIVERCPISEDNSILGSLKKMLSAVASKHLNICVPKCVCDIQDQVEKDVGIVIDRSSIDTGKKKELKKSIQDILTENEDRQLSHEVLRTIKEDISGVVSDLSISRDKKDVLKKTVGETISKDFNEALSNLRHDLNKIRNKLFDDICNIIEKSPIPRDVKIHLKNKLKSVLSRNLDSSLSVEEKYRILDEVSDIVKDDMPEEKRRSLTNKLAKKLDTQQRKEDTNEIDQLTKKLKELEKRILEYIFREMEQAVEEAPIPREKKNELKMKLKDMGTVDFKKPAEDIAATLTDGIHEILDKLNLPIDKTNDLKTELAAAIDEYSKLLKELKEVGPEYIQLKRKSSIVANGKLKKIGNGLMPIEEFDEANAIESILQGIEDIIEESSILEERKKELKSKLKKMAADNLKKPLSDEVLDAMKSGIADLLDELKISKPETDKLKYALINMTDENVANLRAPKQPVKEVDQTKAKESILLGFENIIKESAISEEKKMELKKKLKTIATDNLEKPFSDDVQDAIKIGIADILDALQISKPEKNKLKRELINMTNTYLDNLREAKRPVEEVDEAKAKESILQGIEDIIEESAIPEEKKMELKRKLKKMTNDNLKKPLSDDVLDAIKIGIADILDELKIPKTEKDKLKRALINMTDENVANLQDVDKTRAKENILQGIETIIKESAIPEEKKMELKKKLKTIATDNLEKPFSDDVQDAIKIGIADILDALQISKPEKNKLKRELINMTNTYLDNLREAKRPLEEVDEAKVKENILQGIEDIIEESAIPEEKKMELKRKLKKMTNDNLKKPLSDDVLDAIKIGIADILDELKISKPEKDKLKRALVNMTDENVANLPDVDKNRAKENILQGIETIIKESAIPEEKKMELKRKLKKVTTDNLIKPFSDDVQDAIKIGIADILDELQAPTPEKNTLKRALIDMTNDYLDNLRDAKRPTEAVDEKKAKESILEGIEDIIEESAILEEKKKELKRKLKKMAADNLKKPLSDDVQDALKIGIADILDELQIPKPEKDRLKRALINMTDENVANMQDVDKTRAKENILQGIEKIIKESAIPEEKKMVMKKKMKKITTDNLKKPFSDDVRDAIKIGITDILDELQIPKHEKDKLKRALVNMADENVANLQAAKQPVKEVDQTKAKESILLGIEKINAVSAIPEEKKLELKRKLNKMDTDDLQKPFSDDVQDAIKIGIADLLDDLKISKSEKNKLKRALINVTDENLGELRSVPPKSTVNDLKELLSETRKNMLFAFEEAIDEAPIPIEKKKEVKKKLDDITTKNFQKMLPGDVTESFETYKIIDELNSPIDKTNTLKSYASDPEIKGTRSPVSQTKINMVDDSVEHFRDTEKNKPLKGLMPIEELDETNAKESILRGIENIIAESTIPEEKIIELKRKLKKMATDNLKKPFSDDVEDAIKIGMADILDELQIPKSEKNKLKRALLNMVDENVDNLRDTKPVGLLKRPRPEGEIDETKARERILQGIEKIIEDSAIPEEKNMELKRKLKKMATDNLKKPFSDDVEDAIKIGMADILDELQIPKSEKNKLKRALLNMVDENVDNLRDTKPVGLLKHPRPEGEIDETKARERILQGIEKIIEDSAIPEEKNMELKRKLKKMATDNLKKPFSNDVDDVIKIGIADILDELQIPKPEKNKLKRALLNMVDENLDNLRDTKPVGLLKRQRPEEEIDETKARERILQGIEEIIEDSAIPEDKNMELKRKLKKMATDNLQKPFSDDVNDAIKIGITDILDELQIPKPEKNKLKRALINMADENLGDLRGVTPKLPKRKKMTKTQNNMLLGLEKAIDEAPIPIENKKELKEKLRELAAKNIQTSSDDFEESLNAGVHEIIRELNLPKVTKSPYAKTKSDASDPKIKGTRSPVSQKPLKGLMPIDEVDETNAKESILQGIDKIIKESAIPENKKMELKKKLKKMATETLKKPFSDDVQDAMKIGIADILDELQVPSFEKNKLKRALLNMVDENVDNIQGVPLKLSSEAIKEIENDTQNYILLGLEKAIDEAPIPIHKRKKLKEKLKHMATKNFQKSLSDDTAEALKDGIDEILDELNLPKDKKNKFKSELTAAVDEVLSNLKNEIYLAKSMPDTKRNKLNIIIRRVLPQFDEAVDPSYQKQLAEEFDELLEIALMEGDFNDARRKLIKKLMREQNLSEKEASAPVDELIGRAREMALKEERYELDPSYIKTLEADINDLVGIALVGGDFEDARQKLTKKLMREQNIPEEEASACADDLIGKAQKLALAAQAKDKSLLHKEAFANAISDAVDQSTMSKPEKSDLKNMLLSKLKQHMDKYTYINKDDLEPLKSEVLKDLKKYIDESSIPTAKKNELKSLLNEDLANTVNEIMDHYDDEEGYTKDYTKALSKVVNKSPMRNLEKSYLKKELAKTFEGILNDSDDDKIRKHKEAFTKAINDAVDQSSLSKPDKKSLKNKLLNKMEETVDESPNINDTGALKAEVLKDCKNLVDDSSIPMDQKYELKILLKEEIMDNYDDEEMEENQDKISEYKEAFAKAINEAVSNSPDMDDYDEKAIRDTFRKCKEAFGRAINHAVDQSTLSKPDKNNKKNMLLSKLNETIENSPNLNDIRALTAEVLRDSKNTVDVSSIPTDKKKELKLLLQQAMEDASKELMEDEEISGEAFEIFKDKIAETVKTWMDKLPVDLDPEVATAMANDIASDILDRQKYLQVHPEAVSSDKDEIENLKYQIFRRMKNVVDPKDILPIMDETEELYRMLIYLEPPPGFPKFGLREQSTSERRRRDPVPQDRKKSTGSALSAGNINYSLKELIATSKSIRKQWSRNLDETVTKVPLPRNEKCFLKEKLAIYDETGQINMLSTKSRAKEETSIVQGPKSKKHVTPKSAHVIPKPAQVVPKPTQKNNKGKTSSRLSKIEKAFTFNNTTKQKSPFTPKANEGVDEKDFTKFTADTIKDWLERIRVNIEPDAKKKIIEELTHDVVDRKKYVQVFGSADPTRSDDLEYLKLQVHRRLNGFVTAEALKAIIVDTKVLLTKIDTVKMKVTPVSANGPKSQTTGKKQGIADILDIKAKATNTSVNGDEEEKEQELSNMEFSPGQTSTPGKQNDEPTSEEYKAKVEKSIKTWVETTPIDLEPEAKTDFINELTNDIVDRKKYLQVQPDKTISKKEEIENLRFQVFKRLNKADPDACVTPDDEKVEELYKMIGDGGRKSLTPKQAKEFITALNEEISGILDDYNIGCDRSELHPSIANELTKLGKSNVDQDEIVENLIETIKRLTYLSACVCDEEAEELAHKLLYRTKKLIARIQEKDLQASAGTPVKKKDFKEAVMKDIGDVFNGCPMSPEKRKLMESQLAEDYAKDLGISLEDSDLTMDGTGPESKKGNYGMSFNGLTNFIDTWLSSIHTDDDTKGEDEIKDTKKDLAYSLIHKIGEMNVDPEIFNDDSLYEAVLRDELQNLLGDITISDDDFQALKEDLIKKVLQAQHRAHDEIAGQAYKRKLRDTISKLLPDQRNLSKEDQATMETLKDQLADAYIDLHFSGDNENQRERLKRKIADEINNFCRDYLYRNPCSPLNSRTLNNNLYSALNKVPLPTGDSIRYEVEQARIREEINDWIKELPLHPQNPTEILARNKLVYVLSKKLFDTEVEGDDTDNELMKKEIIKFLNKMFLESGENFDALADMLIDKLKASEESRKYNASSNVIIDAFGNVSTASSGSGMDAPICPAYKPCSSSSPKVYRRPCSRQPKPFPPCSLSAEDRAHLDRIKRRTCLSPKCVSSFMRNNKRDAGVGPRPVDAGSQTVLKPFGIETPQQSRICPVDNEKTPRPCPGVPANLVHPSCSHARRDPFEIEKPLPSPISPTAHENTSRPCPGRTSPQSGHQMRRHTISSSNIESPIEGEVQPQIIIKQYYWNPNEKNSMVSDLQQSGRSSRRQSDPAPYHQPGPVPCQQPSLAPCHQPGPAPCDQTRTSSYAQSTPEPYLPSLDKLQQQNTSPQRMPCDQSFTTPEPKSQHQPSPERYSYWDPQSSFQKPSQRDTPSSRSSCMPSPCMSPFGLNQQSSPPFSPDFSKRDQECRMPKRDGLQDQLPGSSRPCRKERVVELGSLDDVPNARPKKRISDQSDWPYIKFQEDDNFWGLPMRRVVLDEGIDESVVMEREQREERIRCRCKERLIPKTGRSQPRTCPSQEIPQGNDDEQNLKRCSKCCGRHCPYPSFLYFRQ